MATQEMELLSFLRLSCSRL